MTSYVQSNPWRQHTFLDRTSVTVWLVSALPQWPGIVVRPCCANNGTAKLDEKCWNGALSQLFCGCFYSTLRFYSLIYDVCLNKSKTLPLCTDKGHTFFSTVTYRRTAALCCTGAMPSSYICNACWRPLESCGCLSFSPCFKPNDLSIIELLLGVCSLFVFEKFAFFGVFMCIVLRLFLLGGGRPKSTAWPPFSQDHSKREQSSTSENRKVHVQSSAIDTVEAFRSVTPAHKQPHRSEAFAIRFSLFG